MNTNHEDKICKLTSPPGSPTSDNRDKVYELWQESLKKINYTKLPCILGINNQLPHPLLNSFPSFTFLIRDHLQDINAIDLGDLNIVSSDNMIEKIQHFCHYYFQHHSQKSLIIMSNDLFISLPFFKYWIQQNKNTKSNRAIILIGNNPISKADLDLHQFEKSPFFFNFNDDQDETFQRKIEKLLIFLKEEKISEVYLNINMNILQQLNKDHQENTFSLHHYIYLIQKIKNVTKVQVYDLVYPTVFSFFLEQNSFSPEPQVTFLKSRIFINSLIGDN